jgi:hypothetical protein
MTSSVTAPPGRGDHPPPTGGSASTRSGSGRVSMQLTTASRVGERPIPRGAGRPRVARHSAHARPSVIARGRSGGRLPDDGARARRKHLAATRQGRRARPGAVRGHDTTGAELTRSATRAAGRVVAPRAAGRLGGGRLSQTRSQASRPRDGSGDGDVLASGLGVALSPRDRRRRGDARRGARDGTRVVLRRPAVELPRPG